MVYAVVIGLVAYRKLTRASFIEGLEGSLPDVGAVMFLIALSAIVSYGIVYEQVPDRLAEPMLGVTNSLEGVMILVVLFLLIAGFVIDSTVLIIMLTPIFLPLIQQLNGDAVRIVFIVAATIGNFHAAGGRGHVCGVLDPAVSDRRVHARVGSAFRRCVFGNAAADPKPGSCGLRSQPDLRDGLIQLLICPLLAESGPSASKHACGKADIQSVGLDAKHATCMAAPQRS